MPLPLSTMIKLISAWRHIDSEIRMIDKRRNVILYIVNDVASCYRELGILDSIVIMWSVWQGRAFDKHRVWYIDLIAQNIMISLMTGIYFWDGEMAIRYIYGFVFVVHKDGASACWDERTLSFFFFLPHISYLWAVWRTRALQTEKKEDLCTRYSWTNVWKMHDAERIVMLIREEYDGFGTAVRNLYVIRILSQTYHSLHTHAHCNQSCPLVRRGWPFLHLLDSFPSRVTLIPQIGEREVSSLWFQAAANRNGDNSVRNDDINLQRWFVSVRYTSWVINYYRRGERLRIIFYIIRHLAPAISSGKWYFYITPLAHSQAPSPLSIYIRTFSALHFGRISQRNFLPGFVHI